MRLNVTLLTCTALLGMHAGMLTLSLHSAVLQCGLQRLCAVARVGLPCNPIKPEVQWLTQEQ